MNREAPGRGGEELRDLLVSSPLIRRNRDQRTREAPLASKPNEENIVSWQGKAFRTTPATPCTYTTVQTIRESAANGKHVLNTSGPFGEHAGNISGEACFRRPVASRSVNM